jgi:hypothetical protein
MGKCNAALGAASNAPGQAPVAAARIDIQRLRTEQRLILF